MNEQTLRESVKTESHDPAVPEAYAAFMRTGWGESELDLPRIRSPTYAAARRARLAEAFPGERLVLPAGTYKVRANDTDYRFRPDTAHTYFTGNQTSDAVLVIDGRRVASSTPVRARRATPTSSSATGSTASCGPGAARRRARSATRSASRCATSTTCRPSRATT